MSIFTQIVLPVGRITPQFVQPLGTCFFVRPDGMLITTRHVIGNDDANLCVLLPKIKDLNQYQDTTDTRCQRVAAKVVEVDPLRDIAVLKTDLNFGGQIPEIGSFDETNVSEDVQILGYPHAPQGRIVLTLQTTAIGAKVLLDSEGTKSKHAVVNIQARPGQSGSMVYLPRQNRVVGILIGAFVPITGAPATVMGIDPQELHQTTHCISAEYIREML